MAFHYSDQAVYWTYHQDTPADYDPSDETLTRWDQGLFDSYEDSLLEILPEFQLPTDKVTKSAVLMLAEISNGPSARWKVRNASKYYKNVFR